MVSVGSWGFKRKKNLLVFTQWAAHQKAARWMLWKGIDCNGQIVFHCRSFDPTPPTPHTGHAALWEALPSPSELHSWRWKIVLAATDLPCAGGGTSLRHLVHPSCAPRDAGVSLVRNKHTNQIRTKSSYVCHFMYFNTVKRWQQTCSAVESCTIFL